MSHAARLRLTISGAFLAAALLAVPDRSAAQGLGGSWEGQVTQDDPPGTYEMKMELYGSTGSINYPSLGCGGTLRFIDTDGTTYRYRETLTFGVDKCIDGGIVQIRAHPLGDATSWVWRWDGGGVVVRGVIRGSGKPHSP